MTQLRLRRSLRCPHVGSMCCRPLSPCSEVARTRRPESSLGAAAKAGHWSEEGAELKEGTGFHEQRGGRREAVPKAPRIVRSRALPRFRAPSPTLAQSCDLLATPTRPAKVARAVAPKTATQYFQGPRRAGPPLGAWPSKLNSPNRAREWAGPFPELAGAGTRGGALGLLARLDRRC